MGEAAADLRAAYITTLTTDLHDCGPVIAKGYKRRIAIFSITSGIGLAMALTLLTAMTSGTAWPAFHPVLLLVY